MGVLPQRFGGISLARFFVDPQDIKGDTAIITGPDVKHISKVLRMGNGDRLTILDGRGLVFTAEITGMTKDEVTCHLLGPEVAPAEPNLKVTLVQGLPKGDKMETIIQKCTELGIYQIIPLAAARSVVRLDGKKAAERQQRWQRVAMEAAKQCRRPVIPRVQKLCQLTEVISMIPTNALGVIAWEDEKQQSLRQLLQGVTMPEEIYIFIGPEGGFDPEEVARLSQRGWPNVTLGPRILRTETAGPTALTMVLYHYGELG